MTERAFNVDEYLNYLEYLVNIDSGSRYSEGIKKVAEFFKEKYKKLGWIIKEHVFNEEAGPCLEIRNNDKENIDVLVIGHMDTVFPQGTVEERPFTTKGDRAYGPGVADMKSGLLSTYYAIKSADKGLIDDLNICIAINSDEEISSQYSKEWIKELALKSKYAFIMEPGRPNGAMVIERKGLAKYVVDFHGLAAHAGVEPEKGISAIHELGKWIVELGKLNNYTLGTTVNFGIIKGGTAANVVAEKAYAEIDVRYKDENEILRIEEKIQELIDNPCKAGIKLSVEKKGNRPPMNPNEKTYSLCHVIDNISEKLGNKIKWASTGGGSDANFTAAAGVPSIDAMGPIGGGTHGINEYIEVSSIEDRINILKEVIHHISSKRE